MRSTDEAGDGTDHDDPYREVDDLDWIASTVDEVDSSYIERDGVLADNDVEDLPDVPPEELPLREAARDLVRDTPEGRALEEKLEAFDKLDDTAKKKTAPKIRKDIADIVARAVTEEHQRRELLDALASFRNDRTLAASEPSTRQEQHPLVAQLLDVVEDILAELGKEMLIEALLPGAHVLLPPTDFVDSVFTAVTTFEIAEHATWP